MDVASLLFYVIKTVVLLVVGSQTGIGVEICYVSSNRLVLTAYSPAITLQTFNSLFLALAAFPHLYRYWRVPQSDHLREPRLLREHRRILPLRVRFGLHKPTRRHQQMCWCVPTLIYKSNRQHEFTLLWRFHSITNVLKVLWSCSKGQRVHRYAVTN